MEFEGNSSQICEQNTFKVPDNVSKNQRRKKRKNKRKSWKPFYQNKRRVGYGAMHPGNQVLTKTTVWQYEQQIEYWKAQAMALQCEKQVLHSIIRKRKYNRSSSTSDSSESESTSDVESDNNEDVDYNNSEDKGFKLEPTKVLVNFLVENAKFREDAKKEREKFRQCSSSETETEHTKGMEEPPSQTVENEDQVLKEQYGNEWHKISALEKSLQSKFMSDCDRLKPAYWPVIPFYFNFG